MKRKILSIPSVLLSFILVAPSCVESDPSGDAGGYTGRHWWGQRDKDQFKVESFGLAPAQSKSFAKFFRNLPAPDAYRSPGAVSEDIEDIRDWLRETTPRLLVISDRGTSGLDGPVRADLPVGKGEKRNFVDFLRNVGQPPSAEGGGGTFGYLIPCRMEMPMAA